MRKILLRVVFSLAVLLSLLFGLIWASSTSTSPIPQSAAGYALIAMPAPRRAGELLLHIWYPTDGATPITLIAQNTLFYGFHGRRNAQSDGTLRPLVILSHGSGGNAERLGWIASYLAEHGFVVAAVNHAGTTSQDSLPQRTVQPWERAGDVSDIIDFLQKSPPLGLRPDLAHVGVIGFSLGGGTALLTAGARLSKAQFITYCADSMAKTDCIWLAEGGVDFTQIDTTRYENNMRDSRISAALAVDPALTQAMTHQSLAAMAVPVKIINLGRGSTIPAAMLAEKAANAIPSSRYVQIEGAAHFSFLPRCSLFGAMVIGIAGDDNICSDVGLLPRDEIQARLKGEIGSFFEQTLK